MSKTITLLTANALKARRNANNEVKKALEDLIGKDVFENQDVRDRINSAEDARAETGRPFVDFSNVPEDLRAYFEGIYDMVVITEALNQEWKADWNNLSQTKWRSWFNMRPSRFGFGDTYYDCSCAGAGSGSRLC